MERVCKDDPLSLERVLLSERNSCNTEVPKDPAQLLNDLAGDGITKYQNGGIIPDVTSLCRELNLRK
ncbi:hypothetical protein HanRHA438_Chr08g0348581 [Helianthus annuus]|nr:hypothetical protein HanRHA438_Chr08g0348581 [Helianthus annuus]